MPTFVLVDDPLYRGQPPVPQILRSWAMRKLAEAGMDTGDIARYYEVPYATAYKAVKPKASDIVPGADSPSKRKFDPLLLDSLTKSQLMKRAYVRTSDPERLAEIELVTEALDRRFPGWDVD